MASPFSILGPATRKPLNESGFFCIFFAYFNNYYYLCREIKSIMYHETLIIRRRGNSSRRY